MNNRLAYEKYHLDPKVQRKIIGEDNFTYRNIIGGLKQIYKSNMRVLDVGCGVGTLDFYLASNGAKVDAIDISKTAIRIANKTKKILGLEDQIKFYVGDFIKRDLNNTYDLVLVLEVLEHIQDPNSVLVKLHELLKPNGLIYLSVPSKGAPLYKLGLLKKFDKNVGHLRRYSADEISVIIKGLGFRILSQWNEEGILRNLLFTNSFLGRMVKFIRGMMSNLFFLVDRMTIPFFGSSQILLIAQK